MKNSGLEIRRAAWLSLIQILRHEKLVTDEVDQRINKNSKNSKNSWSRRDSAFYSQLIYGYLRKKAYLDICIKNLAQRSKIKPDVSLLLGVTLFQIVFLDRVPAYAAIDAAVTLAKKKYGVRLSSFVNALARKTSTQIDELKSQFQEQIDQIQATKNIDDFKILLGKLAYPDWLIQSWSKRYSLQEMRDLAAYFEQRPVSYIRFNKRKSDLGFVQDELDLVEKQKMLKEGQISIQDISASYVLKDYLDFDFSKFEKLEILDYCSGHGGKSSFLAEQLGAKANIWIHDIKEHKMLEAEENFKRLALNPPKRLEKIKAGSKSRSEFFDLILIDAPCSALGTLGRRPELRWRRKANDQVKFSSLQQKISMEALSYLKKDAYLIYAVCSLEPEEIDPVVALLQAQGLVLLKKEQLWPPQLNCDGFSFAYFRKA